ncbi:N-acyl homoserine lactonase family protein [Methylobacterium sp. J-030]|uniref:N-acyl homoserine lactonase family protein n=1 Tax=Methylobacterium sp. J-030 TaxID=2836627 RepID=UPI001FBA41CE|nr:N-acyl homoserine lactonase family protein [Methylobacterium sp. J-030]MCJ2067332.1 N-acyl homoserine lactonase family protein [Methylobacterium sp. J-030]
MIYEVLAIRYATHARFARDNFIFPPEASQDSHDTPMPMDYFIWLLRSEERTILVDTGFGEAEAQARGRVLLQHPADALRALGVVPESITDVIITHLHYDHAGNLSAFPAARFHLQDAEMAFATGRCMCHGRLRNAFAVEDVVEMVRRVYAGRVRFNDGDATLFPGVSVHLVPGHSRGLQCVRVETVRGAVVLASDAAHYYANMETGNPYPIVVDVAAMAESWARLNELAGSEAHIIPGHDPLVMTRYPRLDRPGAEAVQLHLSPSA